MNDVEAEAARLEQVIVALLDVTNEAISVLNMFGTGSSASASAEEASTSRATSTILRISDG